MTDKISILPQNEIENRIFTTRGFHVMIDSHLAEMYGVEIKRLNEQVKRNIDRFPDSFRFQLTEKEWEFLKYLTVTLKDNSLRSQFATNENGNHIRSQNATLTDRGKHRKYLPYAFTEQGVAMLSAVLRSETAIQVSIRIMNAFVEMRKMVLGNAALYQRLDKIEIKQIDADHKFEQLFQALESRGQQPEKGIFFEGQVFDAYVFVAGLIKRAHTCIILIDNYIDETVLTLLSKREKGVTATIYTRQLSNQFQLDIKKHNEQYPAIEILTITETHDRFLLLDYNELYHIGASLKDLGKKWFAFSRMDDFSEEILNRIRNVR